MVCRFNIFTCVNSTSSCNVIGALPFLDTKKSNKYNNNVMKDVIKLVNVGFNNMVMASRIVTLVSSGSLPVRRMRSIAQKDGRLVDATCGRRTRSVIVTDSNHVILSALQPDTIIPRIVGQKSSK